MGRALNKNKSCSGFKQQSSKNCYPKAEVIGSNPIHRASGIHTANPANGTMTFNHVFIVS